MGYREIEEYMIIVVLKSIVLRLAKVYRLRMERATVIAGIGRVVP